MTHRQQQAGTHKHFFLGGRKRFVLRESQSNRYQKKKRDYANAVLISIHPKQRANLVGYSAPLVNLSQRFS